MKTITIDYDLYQKEIIEFREKGKREFIRRLATAMKEIRENDYREALCILEEEIEFDIDLLIEIIAGVGLKDFALKEYSK